MRRHEVGCLRASWATRRCESASIIVTASCGPDPHATALGLIAPDVARGWRAGGPVASRSLGRLHDAKSYIVYAPREARGVSLEGDGRRPAMALFNPRRQGSKKLQPLRAAPFSGPWRSRETCSPGRPTTS